MRNFFYASCVALLMGLAGCAVKSYEKPIPAMIVLKTPAFKYADQGFVYRGKGRVKVQVYVSGRAAFELSVGKRVCVDNACMGEKAFYEKYLRADYPKGTLAAIFTKRPIFGGEGLRKAGERTLQRIEVPGRFDIIYAFDSRSASFKDRLNRIFIKITEIP
ncbi:hypothetical protein [Hydrogenimonas sp.]